MFLLREDNDHDAPAPDITRCGRIRGRIQCILLRFEQLLHAQFLDRAQVFALILGPVRLYTLYYSETSIQQPRGAGQLIIKILEWTPEKVGSDYSM